MTKSWDLLFDTISTSLSLHEERNTDFFSIKGKTFIIVFCFDVYNL